MRRRASDVTTAYFARRLVTLVATLVAASLVVFSLLAILPGKPAQVILGTQATPEAVAALTKQLGLDHPLWRQYVDWIHGLVTLRLGNSYISQLPIGHQIGQSLGVTVPLIGLGLLVGILIAVPFGVAAALLRRNVAGAAVTAVSQIGIAVPNFIAGLLLILVFGVRLQWLPASGFVAWSTDAWQAFKSLVLPAIALGAVEGALLSRYVRSAVLDVLRSDYLRTARAKGLSRRRALVRHGFRNGAIPVLTVVGLEIPSLIVGAVVVENVFTLPGVGTLLLQAVSNRDLLVVQDVVMLVAVTVLVVNFLVDASYRLLDPRLQVRTR
ncbi:MAG TPA: ABC transporter permease [Gaiellaceae bacterium]|nr:ABC transporter permease [Gaiellaceae bacterium]